MATTLDDEAHEEIDFDRLIVGEPTPQSRSPVNLRPAIIGLVVLVLGGGLGTAAYFASMLDLRDIIGVLDVGDQGPKLAMDMPGRGGQGPATTAMPAKPAAPAAGGMLVPPNAATAETARPEPEAAKPVPEVAKPAPPVIAPPPVAAPAEPQFPAAPAFRDPAPPPSYSALPARSVAPTALPPAPDKMLARETPDGPLPIVGLDGREPWKAYAAPFQPREGWSMVAVVVTGLGLERDATETAIQKLPPEVTLAFSPYATGLDKWVKAAREAGHEVLVGLPTEISGYPERDPGPWALLTSLDPEENIARLERVLVRLPGHVGVVADEGPFVRSEAHLKPILGALKDRGLMYVGDGATGGDLPAHAAVVDIADRDAFREAIDARLAKTAATAKDKGTALVVSSARPVALDRLAAFIARLPGQAIRLAPASAVAVAPAKAGKS